MRFIVLLATYAAGLALAAFLLDGIWFEGSLTGQAEIQQKWLPLVLVALILGLIATFVEPIMKFVSIPFIVLTLGLMLLVINAVTLLLTAAVADFFGLGFHVEGFWNAFLGSIIVTLTGWGIRSAMPGVADRPR